MQTGRSRKILLLLCPALASLCVGLGYLHSGGWAAVMGGLAFLAWLPARFWKGLWSANLGLAVTTTAAAYGLSTGAGLSWMLPAAALALAGWDLLLFDARLADNPPGSPEGALEKSHYSSLGLALGLGILVVALGQAVRFQLPFIFMLALVVLAYLALDRLLRALAG